MYKQLSSHPLFMILANDSIKKLSKIARKVSYQNGDFLVKENEPNEHLFLLLDGAVRIENSVGELIAMLQKGAIVGEVSISGLSLPIANVIAMDDVKAVVFPMNVITELSNQEPSFAEALHRLGMERVMGRLLDS